MSELNEFYLAHVAIDNPEEAKLREFTLMLWESHNDRLFASVVRKVRNASLADDICQDTFLKAITWLSGGAPRRTDLNFAAWLHRIARNLIVDHYRKSSRIDYGLEPDVSDKIGAADNDEATVPEIVSKQQELAALRTCLDSLPDPDRQFIILCDIRGVAQNAVAKQFALATATMFRRLRAAREKLRACFEQRLGIAIPGA